jgi:hypothetical protein
MPTDERSYDANPTDIEGGGWDFDNTGGYDADFVGEPEPEPEDEGSWWDEVADVARDVVGIAGDVVDVVQDASGDDDPPPRQTPPRVPGTRNASNTTDTPPATAAHDTGRLMGNPQWLALDTLNNALWIGGLKIPFLVIGILVFLGAVCVGVYLAFGKKKKRRKGRKRG